MDEESCVDPLLVKMLRETTSEPETTGKVHSLLINVSSVMEIIQRWCFKRNLNGLGFTYSHNTLISFEYVYFWPKIRK